ncbi:hypothetical protein [Spelaeicoccus albus]|uniref:Uncharacterized protein n=1 Tax=Spelaeicoccus albus TaxID=1280376 RepID=A0A7Z0A804_9MICO|nr:hypothetical protein [Spelaeicoccus albus]NYI66119.1 hypothetical protein [Spelaeicoccus albus]
MYTSASGQLHALRWVRPDTSVFGLFSGFPLPDSVISHPRRHSYGGCSFGEQRACFGDSDLAAKSLLQQRQDVPIRLHVGIVAGIHPQVAGADGVDAVAGNLGECFFNSLYTADVRQQFADFRQRLFPVVVLDTRGLPNCGSLQHPAPRRRPLLVAQYLTCESLVCQGIDRIKETGECLFVVARTDRVG